MLVKKRGARGALLSQRFGKECFFVHVPLAQDAAP